MTLRSTVSQTGTAMAEQGEDWSWPVDLTIYDRSMVFREQERLDIAQIMQQAVLPQFFPISLEHLLQPINDVLEICACSSANCMGVRRVLFLEMQQRQQPFWAWTSSDWRAILSDNSQAFEQRYPRARDCRQQVLASAYLLGDFTDFHYLGEFKRKALAKTIFGQARVEVAYQHAIAGARQWGFTRRNDGAFSSVLAEALLMNRSPFLKDLTEDLLLLIRERTDTYANQCALGTLSGALLALGLFTSKLPELPRLAKNRAVHLPKVLIEGTETVAAEWLEPCQRWHATSTLTLATRQKYYGFLLKIGRWLTQEYPAYVQPQAWTREFVAICIAFVDRMKLGEWIEPGNAHKIVKGKVGQPVTPRYKEHLLSALRAFFLDSQEWGWILRRFDPRRTFGTPRSIRSLIGPDPRVISDDVWAKLLWAGLNLTQEDIAARTYPLEMARAMAITWLFCGIRSDEWSRLRLGCARWQREDVTIPGTDEILPKDAVCMLDIPTHKTGTAFTKPVDRIVGEAIEAWERVRPTQPPKIDSKTGEQVHFLFSYRGRRVGRLTINKILIPILCQKAGVPGKDARGNITSHRARSTIATQLFNAALPLSLFELQEWLGHRHISSTQQYAKISPTRLAQSKVKAEYFERNLRLINVLVDQETIKSGAAAQGQPWRYYDLGHGLCTYDFFDTCPHRMACARCSFYIPKGSSLEQILEGKANLLRMKQELSLTEEEVAAVDDGLDALDTLQQKLADIPTPAGLTPKQLQATDQQTAYISAQTVKKRLSKG